MTTSRIGGFDATIDLLASHLDSAGVPEARAKEALDAVRKAVRAMPGAGHIDCGYAGRLVDGMPGVQSRWVTLYRPGSVTPQERPEWTALKLDIAETVDAALRAI